jgi:acid phosphatase
VLHGHTIFREADRHGGGKVYAEGMASRCQTRDSGDYAVKHNPWAYFVDERDLCRRGDVSLTAFAGDARAGRLPTVGMVVPDMCDSAHDCSLATADSWLHAEVGTVLRGRDWASGHLAVVITADEDDGADRNRVLTVLLDPGLRHEVVHSRLDHYSLSRSASDVARGSRLDDASRARSLLGAFGVPVR